MGASALGLTFLYTRPVMAVRSLICRTFILYMKCCSNSVCRQAERNISTARSGPFQVGGSGLPMNSRNRLRGGGGQREASRELPCPGLAPSREALQLLLQG